MMSNNNDVIITLQYVSNINTEIYFIFFNLLHVINIAVDKRRGFSHIDIKECVSRIYVIVRWLISPINAFFHNRRRIDGSRINIVRAWIT